MATPAIPDGEFTSEMIVKRAATGAPFPEPYLYKQTDYELMVKNAEKSPEAKVFYKKIYTKAITIQKGQREGWNTFRKGLETDDPTAVACWYAEEGQGTAAFKDAWSQFSIRGRQALDELNRKITEFQKENPLQTPGGQIQLLELKRPRLEVPSGFEMVEGSEEAQRRLAGYFSWAYSLQLFRNIGMRLPSQFNKEDDDEFFLPELKGINVQIDNVHAKITEPESRKGKGKEHVVGRVAVPPRYSTEDYPKYSTEFLLDDTEEPEIGEALYLLLDDEGLLDVVSPELNQRPWLCLPFSLSYVGNCPRMLGR